MRGCRRLLYTAPPDHFQMIAMPLDPDAIDKIRANLELLERNERAPVISIGHLTKQQYMAINQHRASEGLPALQSDEVLYMGRHHFSSRSADGYHIGDLIAQIKSGMSSEAEFYKDPRKPHSTALINPIPRTDGYGNQVSDLAILELTRRKPRAELFSVIPKNDTNKPQK